MKRLYLVRYQNSYVWIVWGRPHWLNPPCPCRHTRNFEKFQVFYIKKCGRTHL